MWAAPSPLPAPLFSGGSVQLIEPDPPTEATTSLAAGPADQNEYLRASARGARFVSRARQIEVTFDEPTQIIVRDDRRKGSYHIQVLLAVLTGKPPARPAGRPSFKVTGEIDRNPVEITLTPPSGQIFDGLGGNSACRTLHRPPGDRLWKTCGRLGRVECREHLAPQEASDPYAARAGNLNPRVRQAMEMARSSRKGMPVIVSA
jgi:hypothetical protein